MTMWLLLAGGVFGLMIGSFLNVCIGRLPAGESVVHPASRCPHCRTPLQWRDNVPVVSYLWLRGRCRHCHERIASRYPVVEVVTALVFVAQVAAAPAPGWELVSRLVLSALLIALAATDLETFRLPNPLTLGGLAAAIALSIVTPIGVRDAMVGAAAGGGILWIIRWSWLRATGTDAMGLGDVKMLAMIGGFLGWMHVWLVLLLSTVCGAIVGVVLTATGRGTGRTKLPFGVFLAVAALIASLAGDAIINWYLQFLVVQP